MTSNLVETLKREAQQTLSKVAFRNIGGLGNNVSVRYCKGNVTYEDSYAWSHRGIAIKEHQAKKLLDDFDSQRNHLPDL